MTDWNIRDPKLFRGGTTQRGDGMWESVINTAEGETIELGAFAEQDDAVRAYDEARKRYPRTPPAPTLKERVAALEVSSALQFEMLDMLKEQLDKLSEPPAATMVH